MKWTGNNIGATGAMKIGEALVTNNTLTTLNLRGDDKDRKWKKKRKEEARCKWKQNTMKWTANNIGDSGAMKICEALMTNNTLTTLEDRKSVV